MGCAVTCDGPIHIQPTAALKDIRKTDLIIFIPWSTGISVGDVVERNAAVVPGRFSAAKAWSRNRQRCSGGVAVADGLLDGKRATTHWTLAG